MNRKYIHLFISLLAVMTSAVSCRKTDVVEEPEEEIKMYDDTVLPKITMSVTLEEWNRLLGFYDADNRTKDYVNCGITVLRENKEYNIPNAGLRLKGQTSRRRPEAGSSGQKHNPSSTKWQRCHYILRSADGKLVLKYPKEDPTFVREHYCWDLAERYGIWTGIKTSFCRVYIHVEGDKKPAYLGIYEMMESVDDNYLEDRKILFGSEKGFLWKCQWGSNLKDTYDDLFKVDDNTSAEKAYELKTGKKKFDLAKEQIKDFITKLNSTPDEEFPEWIESVCDVGFLLKTYAYIVAIGHWDDMNNFYIYFNSRDKDNYTFYMIPFDLDNTLGTSHHCGVQTDSGRHDPYHWGMDQCTLMNRILKVPEYKAIYTSYLKDFTDLGGPLFGWEASKARMDKWIKLITPYLSNHTGEDMQVKDYPASWGNHPEYRILSLGSDNWFKVKTESIASWILKQ